MYNKLIKCCFLIMICSNLYTKTIRYYCPAPEDFKRSNQTLIAKTNFNHFQHTWFAKDSTLSIYPEFPITFKGANLINCKNNLCELKCYYYSNIENHLITASIKSNIKLRVNQLPNLYLRNFNCQFPEHVDCPFIIGVY